MGLGASPSGVVPVRFGMCKTKMDTSDELVPDHKVGTVAWTGRKNILINVATCQRLQKLTICNISLCESEASNHRSHSIVNSSCFNLTFDWSCFSRSRRLVVPR